MGAIALYRPRFVLQQSVPPSAANFERQKYLTVIHHLKLVNLAGENTTGNVGHSSGKGEMKAPHGNVQS